MIEVEVVAPVSPDSPDDLLVVCSSFEEERALEVSKRLGRYSAKASVVVNFTASSTVEGELRKRRTAQSLVKALAPVDRQGIPRLLSVGPYAFRDLAAGLAEELERRDIRSDHLRVTVDISCLTKIQLIYLVSDMLSRGDVETLRLLYTVPKKYNADQGDKFSRLGVGSFRPVVLPLQEWDEHGSTTTRRAAIVILGHEGQRTLTAWRRIDPEETLLIESQSGDATLDKTCRQENEYLIEYVGQEGRGRIAQCDRLDVDRAREHSYLWLKRFAGDPYAVVSIVPLGPKPVVVGTIVASKAMSNLAVEIVYPMALRYNPNYSEGVLGVFMETFKGK